MGRSWNKFFKRTREPEEGSGAATVTPERDETIEAAEPAADARDEAALEPLDPMTEAEPVAPEPDAKSPTTETVIEEADEGSAGGWFGRLRRGLRRSRESFVGQLNAAVAEFRDTGEEEFWERIEEILITSDVGVSTTAKLVARLEQEALEKNITSGEELRR